MSKSAPLHSARPALARGSGLPRWAVLALAVFAAVTAGCWRSARAEREALDHHPARQRVTWTEALARPLEGRVGPAPAPVLDYLARDNALEGYAARPAAWTPSAEERGAVERALRSLPPRVVELVEPRLVGVFFVEGLGTSGYTETVNEHPDGEEAAFIVFDRLVLSRTANAWATWKEASPFRPGPHRVALTIAPAGADDLESAFRFILLHELGHVVGATGRHHPSWRDVPRAGPFPFQDVSWAAQGTGFAPKVPLCAGAPRLRYYAQGDAVAPNDLLPREWSEISTSSFPTLYASINPFDDFADSFASYVHVVLLGQPWRAEVFTGGERVASYGNGITEERCRTKRELLRALLGP